MNSLLLYQACKKIGCAIFIILSMSPMAFGQPLIELFSDKSVATPSIPGVAIMVFDLSRVEELRKSTPHFSVDSRRAEMQAIAWLGSPEGKQHIDSLQAAYTGHVKMMTYDIQKIPAIVFDQGKFVIYGTSDIALALADYDRFMKTYKPINPSSASKATP